MKTKSYTLLLHPVFLFSLGLLLLNDLYLKNEFHNVITGKLSDFAGLFAFSVFLFSFFPAHKKMILACTGLLFIYWKSPLSGPLISFFNSQLHIPFYRVIDYSDYIALIVLLPALYIRPVYYSSHLVQRLAISLIAIISCLAFTADSLPRKAASDGKIMLEKNIRTKKSEREIVAALKQDGMDVQRDSAIYDATWAQDYYVHRKDSNGVDHMVSLGTLYPDGIYEKKDYGSIYRIPTAFIGNDTLHNIELMISNSGKKMLVKIHSFSYPLDIANRDYHGYGTWRRFKGAITRRFKKILK